jgi:hypothetical protein
MAFILRENPDTPEPASTGGRDAAVAGFQVSAEPLTPDSAAAGANRDAAGELPRVYGTQTLVLMPRDPQSLFAFWDIDWSSIFAEERRRERRVALRVLDGEGAELLSQDVEPLAGNCYLEVPEGGAAYRGEIGYFDASGSWVLVAESETVTTPPDEVADGDATDFATVPFHLSFQRMIDMLRIAKQDAGSLTEMLGTLREEVQSPDESATSPDERRELARVLESAGAFDVPPNAPSGPDLWIQQKLERVLGFGGTSPSDGFGNANGSSFGGSSR